MCTSSSVSILLRTCTVALPKGKGNQVQSALDFPHKLKYLHTSRFHGAFSLDEISLNPVFIRLPCFFANVTFCISMKLFDACLQYKFRNMIHLLEKSSKPVSGSVKSFWLLREIIFNFTYKKC